MTRNSELKKRIRERMKRTGERYTAARAQVLGNNAPGEQDMAHPGIHPGYGRLGTATRNCGYGRWQLAGTGSRGGSGPVWGQCQGG